MNGRGATCDDGRVEQQVTGDRVSTEGEDRTGTGAATTAEARGNEAASGSGVDAAVDPPGGRHPASAADGDMPPKMYRRRGGRALAGVAGGLADHLGVKVLWVRATFAVLAAFGGMGLLAYALLWMFVPQQPGDEKNPPVSAKERQQTYGLVALGLGLAVVGSALTGLFSGWVGVPLAVALVGAAVVWREADESQRRRWRDGARTGVAGVLGGGGVRPAVRVLAGVALVVAGIGVVVFRGGSLDQVQFALIAVLATLVGVAVLTVPFWLRLIRDLGEERRARIRTEERAEIAAHLHDSVLQTLALIQKQADMPREVARLARSQERQLRQWLYGPSGYGSSTNSGRTRTTNLSEALATACGEVEDTFAISVQQVVVGGEVEVDDRLGALIQAAREAIVNAAKHAGVEEVSVYAEVEHDAVTVFVRDRGRGFDPEAVGKDRHGLADSIKGRMERNGGTCRLRTAPGEGTEVQLEMPRRSADRSAQGAT
ncbi:ATP-binding protein [Saccharomonospora sp. NB11]|jgi:signal transduction histidine kinase/phage shock protein PspC (stress-responsive transcriptional regulator)|uniref:ATP-binding protein n=1 Tax=Saccharomonospora sp. NB11 TaxID=1642298 RepID=UPI0018D12733|nr:ATP-binding protein [Saccharomonospora sp. NB11]